MSEVLKEISKILKKAKTAVIISHVDPDYDSIGSTIALARMFKALNIKTTMYSEDLPPEAYNFLPSIKDIRSRIEPNEKFDVGITVDSADLKRIGTKLNLKNAAKIILNIDHHPDNTMFGDINYVESVSSVAELIYRLCKHLNIKIDKDMAICLYTAMLTDTGSFRYENTTTSTFLMAADLVEHGASPNWIATRIYDTKTAVSLKTLAKALSNFEVFHDGKVVSAALAKRGVEKMKAKGEDFTGIIDALRSLKGAEVAIFLREEKRNKIKINFRSKKYVNVQKIAKIFGGGGHIRAAGAIVTGRLSEVKAKVISAVLKVVKNGRNYNRK